MGVEGCLSPLSRPTDIALRKIGSYFFCSSFSIMFLIRRTAFHFRREERRFSFHFQYLYSPCERHFALLGTVYVCMTANA